MTQLGHKIPSRLLQPLWLRSRESMIDNGLIYDPIAAAACRHCHLSSECLSGDIDQKQLLHATLTVQCDQQVSRFLKSNPSGWVVNVGAGLDTRFYRLDNGRCHWLELDINENLLWRQKLFHTNERYYLRCGSVTEESWVDNLPVPHDVPVMIVCEHALLECNERQLAKFVQLLGRRFHHAEALFVVAGDRCNTMIGKKLGSIEYQHGLSHPKQSFTGWLPWIEKVSVTSPIEHDCARWKLWQRWLAKFPLFKHRVTPLLIHMNW